ncbi:MAG: 3-phosphoshikimate 1-carboxyvinyltransferase [Clostridia bacterium]|nr:3-phosphoshikimate 1-carboxyvinyltransferase [Clostridia bacterium]
MKNALIYPFSAAGRVCAPPSKSAAHRLLICSALADRETELILPRTNDDIEATIRCLRALGANIERSGGKLKVFPIQPTEVGALPELDCGESGSTLRFLLPVAAALRGARFSGRGRLPERPMDALTGELRRHGSQIDRDRLPITVQKGLTGGVYTLPGNVSSQYFTGLLFASVLTGGMEIRAEGELQSIDYIRMTVDAMAAFGVRIRVMDNVLFVDPGQAYRSPGRCAVEGDWSSAAFPLCLGALTGSAVLTGLLPNSAQGDKRILPLLERIGARVKAENNQVTVTAGAKLRAIEEDVSDIPDLVPVLAAVLMHAEGRSRLYHAERLRLKESDRLETTRRMILDLGGEAQIQGDDLIIVGKPHCPGGTVDGAGDHRIVMAAAVAAARCAGDSVIQGAGAVDKSYPDFFEDYQTLGGIAHVVDIR